MLCEGREAPAPWTHKQNRGEGPGEGEGICRVQSIPPFLLSHHPSSRPPFHPQTISQGITSRNGLQDLIVSIWPSANTNKPPCSAPERKEGSLSHSRCHLGGGGGEDEARRGINPYLLPRVPPHWSPDWPLLIPPQKPRRSEGQPLKISRSFFECNSPV